jgi:hypothetical protein
MIQKLKNSLLAIAALVTLAAPVFAPAAVYAASNANIPGGLCTGADLKISDTPSNCPTDGGGSTTGINNLLRRIVNIFSAVVGVIAVIMIIVGGLRYITSGGDSSKVSTAKNSIIYAIVGLVIVALAQLIVRFVLNQSSGLANS